MKEAKRLIREGNESFAEISNRLGFSDPHYFSRIFKKICGQTPMEYKSEILKAKIMREVSEKENVDYGE